MYAYDLQICVSVLCLSSISHPGKIPYAYKPTHPVPSEELTSSYVEIADSIYSYSEVYNPSPGCYIGFAG